MNLLLPCDLEKARLSSKPQPGQGALSFDEEAHPRAESGHHDDKYRGGEFVPKEAAHVEALDQPGPLSRVADRVESGLPLKAVWSAIHAEAPDVDQLGEAFRALREEADCSQTYLGNVLKKRYNTKEAMTALLRSADRRHRGLNPKGVSKDAKPSGGPESDPKPPSALGEKVEWDTARHALEQSLRHQAERVAETVKEREDFRKEHYSDLYREEGRMGRKFWEEKHAGEVSPETQAAYDEARVRLTEGVNFLKDRENTPDEKELDARRAALAKNLTEDPYKLEKGDHVIITTEVPLKKGGSLPVGTHATFRYNEVNDKRGGLARLFVLKPDGDPGTVCVNRDNVEPATEGTNPFQTCTRCGGSGEYAYNQIHGTMCYGCGGSGLQVRKPPKAKKTKGVSKGTEPAASPESGSNFSSALDETPDLKNPHQEAPKADTGPFYHDTYTGPRFTYGGQNRPLGYAAIPDGWVWGSNREHPSFRHGVVDYPRELTPQELYSYELERHYADSESGGMSPEQLATAGAWVKDFEKDIPSMSPEDRDMMVGVVRAHKQGPAALREYLDGNRATNYYAQDLADNLRLKAPLSKSMALLAAVIPPLQLLLKAKAKVMPGQTGFNFDEEAHPRAAEGTHDGKYRGGEFVPKTTPEPVKLELPKESLRPSDENYKYRDTGYIAGSRKEQAAAQIKRMARDGEPISSEDIDWDDLESNPREAASLITKANVFGASSFDEMEARGVEPGAAFLIQKIYASVAPKPDDSPAARRNYVAGIDNLRDRLEEVKTVPEAEAALEEIQGQMEGYMFSAEQEAELAALKVEIRGRMEAWRAEEKAEKELQNAFYGKQYGDLGRAHAKAANRKERGWKPDPKLDAQIEAGEKEAEEAHRVWQARLTSGVGKRLYAEYQAASDKASTLREIGKLTNMMQNPLWAAFHSLGESFDKVIRWRRYKGSEAFRNHMVNAKAGKIKDYSFARGEKTVKRATNDRIQFQLGVADAIERVGGRPIEVDSTMGLKNHFGLRDVQSGEWVLNDVDAAKFHVENASTALQDMADALGISDKDSGFNGRMALAFGARGRGGAGAAAAHYEPVHRVINLTKIHGCGTLAHEWFHAFDNLVTEAASGESTGKDRYTSENTGKLPAGPIRDAYSRLMEAIDTSDFKAEAVKLDRSTRRARYWSAPSEMAARAFASFVQDGLAEGGRKNTYLTANNRNEDYAPSVLHIVHPDGSPLKPCPEGAEREKFNALFRGLFAAVRADGTLQKSMALMLPVNTPPFLFLLKAKVMPGQMGLDFDAEAHPRAPVGGHGEYKGGEFVPKAEAPKPDPILTLEKPQKEKKGLFGGGVMGYKEAVAANLKHMGTSAGEWASLPIEGMAEAEDGGKSKMVPMFDFTSVQGYSDAPTLFPQDANTCCELCGHTIQNVYWLKNDTKRWTLRVGSECVTNFQEGKSGAELTKEAKWEMNRDLLRQVIDARRNIWNRFTVEVHQGYGRMKHEFPRTAPKAATIYGRMLKLTKDMYADKTQVSPFRTDDAQVTRWVNKNRAELDELLTEAGYLLGEQKDAKPAPMHEPLGAKTPSHVPVGGSMDPTETPAPTQDFRLLLKPV